jgi:catalase
VARRVRIPILVAVYEKLTVCREHSKTIGGIPVASDVFLFQKQQTFNRSKNLERMVHPSGSGAFGYFETTKDVTGLTVGTITIYET